MEAELAEAEQVVVATVQRNAELESSMRLFAASTFRLEESASIGAAIQNQREALIVSAAHSEVIRLSSMLEDAPHSGLGDAVRSRKLCSPCRDAGAAVRGISARISDGR